jgi:hypothetical protein
MVYPVFEIGSIKKRCISDIQEFCDTLYSVKDETNLTLLDKDFTKESMNSVIKIILEKMVELGLDNNANYVDKISKIYPNLQKQLWICRTYLFYQLLIFATATFNDETLYNIIYDDKEKFPYRGDIVNELINFKMGIFGSKTPTSDIDIGIQYSGTNDIEPALAYIVSRFEDLFIIFTGKSSLDFDIETYADMMTIPNPDHNDTNHQDLFYLDASKFSDVEFNKMLECAGNSIIRNLYLGNLSVNEGVELSSITFEKELELLKFNMFYLPNITKEVRDSLKNKNWLENSKKNVLEFLESDYKTQRYKYYEKVEEAERIKFDKLKKGFKNVTPSEICDIMVAIGESLTYRMESYTCAPTVIHVVRILQASKENAEKYKTLEPKTYCKNEKDEIVYLDPFCTIGYYGYILSMLEQFGYLYRFYISYCESEYYDSKCVSKEKKYWERYNNALLYFGQMEPYKSVETSFKNKFEEPVSNSFSQGGKKNKHTRRKKK